MTRSHAFSRALRQPHVITSSFDWFNVLSVSYVIGQSNYFGFGFTTLKRKPLYHQYPQQKLNKKLILYWQQQNTKEKSKQTKKGLLTLQRCWHRNLSQKMKEQSWTAKEWYQVCSHVTKKRQWHGMRRRGLRTKKETPGYSYSGLKCFDIWVRKKTKVGKRHKLWWLYLMVWPLNQNLS